jgi:hypothetical protein
LVWIPAAVLACGETPAQPVPEKPIVGDLTYVHKTVHVEIKGKLVWVRCLMFGKTSVGIYANGQTYWLDIANKQHLELAQRLGDQNVIVTGELEQPNNGKDLLVKVTDLKADESEYVKQTVKVELSGTLTWYDPNIIAAIDRPHFLPRTWTVIVDGKNYDLDFGDRVELLELARKLDGKTVIVTGTLDTWVEGIEWEFPVPLGKELSVIDRKPMIIEKNLVHVTSLKVADNIIDFVPVVPPDAPAKAKATSAIKVRFVQTPGVPDPLAAYSVSVEMDGRKHTVDVDEGTCPAALRPLIEWLAARWAKDGIMLDTSKSIGELARIDLQGVLVLPNKFIEETTPEGVSGYITVNGQTYWLDLGEESDQLDLAQKLKDQPVSVTGHLECRPTFWTGNVPVVVVTSLQAAVIR